MVGKWIFFLFFFLNKTKSHITFRNIKSFSVSNLCMRLEWFSTRWVSLPGGRHYLWLVIDIIKIEKEKNSTQLRKLLPEHQVSGGGFMGSP